MEFDPDVNQDLIIAGATYRIAQHPSIAEPWPHVQSGGMGKVYHLTRGTEHWALKVLDDAFRRADVVRQADQLHTLAATPGLRVCERTVLTRTQHAPLLQQYPDLEYAILMPWIVGDTWSEVIQTRSCMPPLQCLVLARSLANTLAGLESRTIAHCDLSGSNLIFPASLHTHGSRASQPAVRIELVDVEQLYAPGLARPAKLLCGTPGYTHDPFTEEELWSPVADRFAGAVLLAEILGWCSETVRKAASKESYFAPEEMHQSCQRYALLMRALQTTWSEAVADLFGRAWSPHPLAACPSFAEWQEALNRLKEESVRRGFVKPILDHLRQRLRQMGRAVLSEVRSKMDAACRQRRAEPEPLPEDQSFVDREEAAYLIAEALRCLRQMELPKAHVHLELAEICAPPHLRPRIAVAARDVSLNNLRCARRAIEAIAAQLPALDTRSSHWTNVSLVLLLVVLVVMIGLLIAVSGAAAQGSNTTSLDTSLVLLLGEQPGLCPELPGL
jgi:hypothetical protein